MSGFLCLEIEYQINFDWECPYTKENQVHQTVETFSNTSFKLVLKLFENVEEED